MNQTGRIVQAMFVLAGFAGTAMASAQEPVDLDVMARDAKKMRGPGPVVFAQVKHGGGVDDIIAHVLHAWQHASGVAHHH